MISKRDENELRYCFIFTIIKPGKIIITSYVPEYLNYLQVSQNINIWTPGTEKNFSMYKK